LTVWQKAIDLVGMIYMLTREYPPEENFGLTNQMRRCAVSIPSNIAEGQGRSSSKEFERFLRISLGSLAELDTQMEISRRLGYVKGEDNIELEKVMLEIRKMIFGLIKSLQD
jgi:four helix bundle protein